MNAGKLAEPLREVDNAAPPAATGNVIDFVTDEPESILEGLRPLVKPGVYDAIFDTWHTALMFGGRTAKLVLTFALTETPMGTRLERFYNVRRLIGKPRKRGRFVVGAQSDFAKEFARLTRCKRLDRIACSALEGRVYRVTVRTVVTAADQSIVPDALHYSVIARVDPE